MIDQLKQTGRIEPLIAIRDGKTTFLQVLEQWRKQTLNQMDFSDSAKPFSYVYTWLDSYDKITDKTRTNYRVNFKQLEKIAKAKATVADIPALLKKYKDQCLKKKTGRMFNTTRNACRSFLNNAIGKYSTLYRDVEEIETLNEAPARKHVVLSVEEVEALTRNLDPAIAAMVWFMVTTGIEQNVYWAKKYEAKPDRVLIHGGKKKWDEDDRRNRYVPLIYPPVPPSLGVRALRKRLAKAGDKPVRIADFRNTFSSWMYEAGIPEPRIELYMGHLPAKMTRDYARKVDITKFLTDDAAKVKKYINELRKTKPHHDLAKARIWRRTIHVLSKLEEAVGPERTSDILTEPMSRGED